MRATTQHRCLSLDPGPGPVYFAEGMTVPDLVHLAEDTHHFAVLFALMESNSKLMHLEVVDIPDADLEQHILQLEGIVLEDNSAEGVRCCSSQIGVGDREELSWGMSLVEVVWKDMMKAES